MTMSDWIATGALIIASASAYYARRSVKLAPHVHKVAIYEEVVSFSDCFRGVLTVPTAQRVEQFRKKAVQRSEIYLPEEIHKQLEEIYCHCSDKQTWLDIAESDQGTSSDVPNEFEIRGEYKSVLTLLHSVTSGAS